MAILTCSGKTMPCPISIKSGDEIIWSSNTGRTSTGKMVGDVVAEKKDIEIVWAYLRDSDIKKIKAGMPVGFFKTTFYEAGEEITFTGYRGTITKNDIGNIGDGLGHCYDSVSVSIVQQ
jgi:hypothetical protein